MRFAHFLKILVLGVCILFLAVPAGATPPKKIRAISGNVGGAWYMGFGSLGKMLTTAIPGLEYNLLAGGSMANPMRIESGDGDLALTELTNIVAAKKGLAPYKKPVSGVNSIGSLCDSPNLNIIVRDDCPIYSLQDLKDKKYPLRLATARPGSASYLNGVRALEAYGITTADIQKWKGKLFSNNYDDVANMVKDNQVDMVFWSGVGEAGWANDVIQNTKLRWISIDAEHAKILQDRYGLIARAFPAGMYSGKMPGPVTTVGDVAEFIVPEKMPEAEVYGLLKVMFENWGDVVLGYPAWSTFTKETAWKSTGFELHPGAVRFYREFGGMK